jgi:fucose permease
LSKVGFICGFIFLLIGAFNDNLRGPLLPYFANVFDLDYASRGYFLVLGNFAALAMTLCLMPVLNRFSIKSVSFVTIGLTSSVLLGSLLVDSTQKLLIWGTCLGGVISVCGALCNVFTQNSTTPELRSRAMSGVQAAYGLASFLAPLVAGVWMSRSFGSWQIMFLLSLVLLLTLAGLLPLLKGTFVAAKSSQEASSMHQPQSASLELVHIVSIATIVLYVGAEVLISMWMTTWFVSSGRTIEEGSQAMALFFALMTISRLICTFWVKPKHVHVVLIGSLILALIGFCFGRLSGLAWMVGVAGLLGPFFPLFVAKMSLDFPDRDRTIIIWTIALMQGFLGILNLSIGGLADFLSIQWAYWLPAGLLVICLLSYLFSCKMVAHRRRDVLGLLDSLSDRGF